MGAGAWTASVLPSLVWAAVAVFAIRTFAQVAKEFAPVRNEPVSHEPPEIPKDLMSVAAQETEDWARAEVVRVIRERYEDLKDWNLVRAAMGVGRIDA